MAFRAPLVISPHERDHVADNVERPHREAWRAVRREVIHAQELVTEDPYEALAEIGRVALRMLGEGSGS